MVKRWMRISRRAMMIISLMLCLAAIAAWGRSHFVSDSMTWTSRDALILCAGWGSGKIDLVSARCDPSVFIETESNLAMEKPKPGCRFEHARPPEDVDDWSLVPPQHELKFLGASFRSGKVLFFYVRDLTVPIWILVVLFAIGPIMWGLKRWRRRGPGYCAACG